MFVYFFFFLSADQPVTLYCTSDLWCINIRWWEQYLFSSLCSGMQPSGKTGRKIGYDTMAVFCTIFSLMWFPVFTWCAMTCNNNLSQHGFALLNHVYKSFLADRLVSCYISCNMQPACQSLNYNLADKTCELNNDTKYFRPKHFVEKPTFVYAENHDSGKRCEIIPCGAHTETYIHK